MKKFLLPVFILAAITSVNTVNAQCDLSLANLVITPSPTSTDITGPKCIYVFNAEFDITTNSGFKYLFFHTWRAADYPNPAIFDCTSNASQDPGTAVQLGTAVDDAGKSFLDFGFFNLNTVPFVLNIPVDVTSFIATTYPEASDVVLTQPSNSPGMTAVVTLLPGNVLNFKITNVKIIVPGTCGTPLVTKSDIWGSNSNSGTPKAQCCLAGIGENFNDPLITLTKICNAFPFSYTVGITTTSGPYTNVVYKVYMDGGDGIEDPNGDDILINTVAVGPIPPNYPVTAFPLANPYSWSDAPMYARLTANEFINTISTGFVDPICLVFPVKLVSFNAVRNQSNVELKWQTAQEENNYGFDIERLIGNGGWQKVGFVPSQGKGGSSHTTLNYQYTDVNNLTRGVSQYRLKQIDIDRRSEYSTIKLVNGMDQKSKTLVFPNPSYDGKVNVMFDQENMIRNVSVVDINGRTVKQWKGVTGSNIQMDNLPAGIYTLRIINTKTNQQTVEKFIVNKR